MDGVLTLRNVDVISGFQHFGRVSGSEHLLVGVHEMLCHDACVREKLPRSTAGDSTVAVILKSTFEFQFYIRLAAIHNPFEDGNGRLSRVLTTLLLLQAGYAYVPYNSLESIVEQNKQGYYLALRRTQGTIRSEAPKWEPWILFFLRSLASQMIRLEGKVQHETLMLSTLPELSLLILNLARDQGQIAINDVVTASQANRNTVSSNPLLA